MKYFVSSDIHGFYTEWINALKESKFDITNPNHKLIVCGDLFDRGTECKELQSFIMELLKKDKIILIKGNHEDLALELIENYYYYTFNIKQTHHWQNGTFQTLLSLTDMSFNDATTCLMEFKIKAKETDYVKKIIPKMKNFYETDKYIFVHSWIPLKENLYEFNKNWRSSSSFLWEKARWLNPLDMYKLKLYDYNKTIVFGHWHCSAFWHYKFPKKYNEFGESACFLPFVSKEIIALDTCTAYTKKVNVMILED